MSSLCHHCGEPVIGKAYRVMSEESGVTFLDMLVCYFCYLEAKNLGLYTQKIEAEDSAPKPRYTLT